MIKCTCKIETKKKPIELKLKYIRDVIIENIVAEWQAHFGHYLNRKIELSNLKKKKIH